MDVKVERAHAYSKTTLRNLMQLYFYDMSQFKPRAIDAQGLYHYKYFDAYWSEPERYPFLIRVDGAPVGFALIRFIGGTADVAEFFVMRDYRRKGVGSIAAKQLFETFRGAWQVRQEPKNFVAQSFWRAVILGYTGGDFDDLTLDDEHRGPAQRFDSRRTVKEA